MNPAVAYIVVQTAGYAVIAVLRPVKKSGSGCANSYGYPVVAYAVK